MARKKKAQEADEPPTRSGRFTAPLLFVLGLAVFAVGVFLTYPHIRLRIVGERVDGSVVDTRSELRGSSLDGWGARSTYLATATYQTPGGETFGQRPPHSPRCSDEFYPSIFSSALSAS